MPYSVWIILLLISATAAHKAEDSGRHYHSVQLQRIVAKRQVSDQTEGKTAAEADSPALSRALIAAICASCGVIVTVLIGAMCYFLRCWTCCTATEEGPSERKKRSRKKSENHASGLKMRSERGKSSKRHRHRNHHRGAQRKKNSIGNISDYGGKLNGNMPDNNAYYPQFVLSNQDYQNPDYADPRGGQNLIPVIPDYEKNYSEKEDLEKENTCKERRHRKHKNASSSRGEVSHTLKRTPSGNVVEYAQISKTSQKISHSQSNKKRRRHSSEHSHGSGFSRTKSVGHYRARSQEPLVQSQIQQQSGGQFPPQSHLQPYYPSQSLNYANYSLPPPSHTLQQQQQYALSAQPTAAYNPTPSATAGLPPPHRPSHFNSSDFQTDSGAKIWMVRS